MTTLKRFATVDYANIDKLLSALRTLMLTNITTDRFQFTEVEYEIDDLKIIVFNNDRGISMAALSASSVTVHYTAISKLDEIRRLVESAKAHLDQHRIG